jgi:hypothetical protein
MVVLHQGTSYLGVGEEIMQVSATTSRPKPLLQILNNAVTSDSHHYGWEVEIVYQWR